MQLITTCKKTQEELCQWENGRQLIISISKQQKVNTKSFTEAELVGRMTQFHRCDEQGTSWKHKDMGLTRIYFTRTTRARCYWKITVRNTGPKKKHINVRYYFITDKVETRDVVIEHLPTEEMLGDHFTKPLQGTLFSKFRTDIMNIPDDLDMGQLSMDRTGLKMGITCKLHTETDPGCPQECVENCDKLGQV